MATTSTTPTTGVTPTANTNLVPQQQQKLAAPTATVQPVSAYSGGNQTPTPAPQVMDPLAFSGAPAGFTQGTGTMAGATYYQGSKVIGYDNAGNPMLENGQTIQGAKP